MCVCVCVCVCVCCFSFYFIPRLLLLNTLIPVVSSCYKKSKHGKQLSAKRKQCMQACLVIYDKTGQHKSFKTGLRKSRHASATALLRTLHWLPVKARIQYKIACLCFQCIYQNSMPPYISDLLHPYCPSRALRSLDTSLLTVPRFSLETFGKKSFSVFGPTVWNLLPLSLRKTQFYNF